MQILYCLLLQCFSLPLSPSRWKGPLAIVYVRMSILSCDLIAQWHAIIIMIITWHCINQKDELSKNNKPTSSVNKNNYYDHLNLKVKPCPDANGNPPKGCCWKPAFCSGSRGSSPSSNFWRISKAKQLTVIITNLTLTLTLATIITTWVQWPLHTCRKDPLAYPY